MSAEHGELRQYQRHPRRIACTFQADGVNQRAFITNISARGFLIETRSQPKPGDDIVVSIEFNREPPICVIGSITRTLRPHRSTTMINKSGFAVQVSSAPEAYYQMILKFGEK